jgi:hypothetical protein
MSKNTAKKNKVISDAAPAVIVPATVETAPTALSLAEEIAGIEKRRDELLAKQKSEADLLAAKIAEKNNAERALIDSLMATVGVDSLDALIERIEARQRLDRTSNRGNVISDDTKKAIEAVLRSENPPTAAKIAETYGVSIPWIQLYKGKLGLVKTRTATVS